MSKNISIVEAFSKHISFDAAENTHIKEQLATKKTFQEAVEYLVNEGWGLSWFVVKSIMVELGQFNQAELDKLTFRIANGIDLNAKKEAVDAKELEVRLKELEAREQALTKQLEDAKADAIAKAKADADAKAKAKANAVQPAKTDAPKENVKNTQTI